MFYPSFSRGLNVAVSVKSFFSFQDSNFVHSQNLKQISLEISDNLCVSDENDFKQSKVVSTHKTCSKNLSDS